MQRFESIRRIPGQACLTRGTAMAHRRGFVCGQALRAGLAVVALTTVVAGSVYVSTETTRLRASVGELTDQRDFLKAQGADLQGRWIAETAPTAIVARVRAETDLQESGDPDFVLLTREAAPTAGAGFLQRVLADLTGGTAAHAAPAPEFVAGTMVSLAPRSGGAGSAP